MHSDSEVSETENEPSRATSAAISAWVGGQVEQLSSRRIVLQARYNARPFDAVSACSELCLEQIVFWTGVSDLILTLRQ